jgi:hypothetical protein
MNLIGRYEYPHLEKITQPSGVRHYICPDTGLYLPSVTTIIEATADNTGLREWRERIGEDKAEQARREATGLGSLMHRHLECHILGQSRPGGNNHVRIMAERMADQIIARGLPDIDEVWGSEVMLYASELFAGTSDLTGLYKGRPAIMDFKTCRKMKVRTMIEDYFHQLGGYGLAHDERYGTEITTGVIFMVSRDYQYQSFVIEGEEFILYQRRFITRLEQYLANTK